MHFIQKIALWMYRHKHSTAIVYGTNPAFPGPAKKLVSCDGSDCFVPESIDRAISYVAE
jgi:hypothetical protein